MIIVIGKVITMSSGDNEIYRQKGVDGLRMLYRDSDIWPWPFRLRLLAFEVAQYFIQFSLSPTGNPSLKVSTIISGCDPSQNYVREKHNQR